VEIRFRLVSFTVCRDFKTGMALALRLEEALESSVEFYISSQLILFTALLLFRIGTLGFKMDIFQIVPIFFPNMSNFRRTREKII